ncbi:MAG: hypothetical protein PUE56_03635 [Clostridium sp.]|nr:hypothetical protein [Clostridium sp.]
MGIIAKMTAPVNRYWQKGENMAQPREMQPPVAKIFSNVKQSMLPQPTKMGMIRVSSGESPGHQHSQQDPSADLRNTI